MISPEPRAIPVFGTLTDLAPRAAWAHEALDFTPWLATNLDRLSTAIGIPLELTGREVGVGRYAADILATEPGGGATVLIENQLEASDHTHLGQIMTYLAGLEAEVVVWVAPEFREEHLSALRWLNQHTDDRFSFFAVRLRVVRIGDSALAPLLEVLEKPNSWDRSLHQQAKAVAAPSERTALLRAFWARYAEKYPAAARDLGAGRGVARWRVFGDAESGFVLSRYVSNDHVGIFPRGGRGRDGTWLAPRLETHAPTLVGKLGVEWGNDRYPFDKRGPTIAGPEDWDAAIDWLEAETRRYAATLTPLLLVEDDA